MKHKSAVALVEFNWAGHHPTYFKLFVRALLELGFHVLALCPEPEEVRLSTDDLDPDAKSRLTLGYAAWAPAIPGVPSRVERRPKILRLTLQIRNEIRRWEAAHAKRIELVFFACIYDYHFRRFSEVEWLLPCRWSGLYLHCRSFRKPGSVIPGTGELPCPEHIFRSTKLHSIAVLDEGAMNSLERLSNRPVVAFPDLTDEAIDVEPTPLSVKIKRFASGSPIIAAVGHLLYTKGITTLARVAADRVNSDLFFVFAGEIDLGSFKPDDRLLITRLMDHCPNVYTHFARISDGPIFNSVIRACDVLFAAYLDFPNSSNTLTKAAVFQKPVIVSDGYLMAERTRKHSLGEVIPEGDINAAGRAIREILNDQRGWLAARRPKWQEYHKEHSYQQLKDSFGALLAAA
jgi:glycosyltransferase involved in cell wall biosynthesis